VLDAALAGYDHVGRHKNDNYKRDAEWQRQHAIWLDPPGETPSQGFLNRLAAIRRMYEIEVRISC
jgi:hypothetical protein